MADPYIEVTLTEFPAMKSLGSFPTVTKVLSKHYGVAGRRVGSALAAKMRAIIRAGLKPDNHPLTVAFKRGSTKPGVDKGRMFKAITWKISGISDRNNVIEIGVRKENAAANVAKAIHDGVQIPVTAKMSLLFKAVLAASKGRGTVRSARGQELLRAFNGASIGPPRVGTVIVIPPRPFAKFVLEDPATSDLITKEYQNALVAAMIELGK